MIFHSHMAFSVSDTIILIDEHFQIMLTNLVKVPCFSVVVPLGTKLETKLSTISDFTSDTISELRDTIWAMNMDEISFEDLEVRITNFIEKAKLYDANISFQFKIDESLDKSLTMSSFKGMNT